MSYTDSIPVCWPRPARESQLVKRRPSRREARSGVDLTFFAHDRLHAIRARVAAKHPTQRRVRTVIGGGLPGGTPFVTIAGGKQPARAFRRLRRW